ncbi:hypothetical protein OH799_18610 [Nocardia sp. NBC_00881]|uniref:hypothetical protein n=1 Tax=Nocardia sp. NBC_00881 TaxID=2975995 RepID=UPI00386D4C17|nr:hypothetical protein OH799_18610 [Nocardia sp. NBC_00881]
MTRTIADLWDVRWLAGGDRLLIDPENRLTDPLRETHGSCARPIEATVSIAKETQHLRILGDELESGMKVTALFVTLADGEPGNRRPGEG